MAYAPSQSTPIVEGVFAINKPPGASSAQVIRDVQSYFTPSQLFKPWIEAEQARKDAESHNQKRKRSQWKQRQKMQVKMGHGGTLDPMATGVLILGVGAGTKSLSRFLECTKSYETVVLFGAATDTYDTAGKVVARQPYGHVTKEVVEEALSKFRGNIMQRPPIFSALRVQGKRLYEYAREGKEVPVEIQERPLTVEKLEMVDWYNGRTHEWHWPKEEAEKEEKVVAEKVLHLGGNQAVDSQSKGGADGIANLESLREQGTVHGAGAPLARQTPDHTNSLERTDSGDPPNGSTATASHPDKSLEDQETIQSVQSSKCPSPACRLRMTTTSGFYVRSLCHDLGAAVGSLGIMASLVRTRQADFEIGRNVLSYEDLGQGEDVWGPKVRQMLVDWQASERKMIVDKRHQLQNHNFAEEFNEVDAVSEKDEESEAVARRKRRRNTSSDEDR